MLHRIKAFFLKKSMKHEIESMMKGLKGSIGDDKRAMMESKLKAFASQIESHGVEKLDQLEEMWAEMSASWDPDWQKVKHQFDKLVQDLKGTAQKRTSDTVIKGLNALSNKLKELDQKIKK